MRWALVDGSGEIDAWTVRESDRQSYRGRISCPDPACSVGLSWRKRSTDGKAPTFFGNHRNGCDYKTESEAQVAERELEEVNSVFNTCEEMKIRLETFSRLQLRAKAGMDPVASPGTTHQHRGNDRVIRAGSTGLRPLLRKLITSPSFRENRMPLTLSDGTRTTIADGCQHVDHFVFSSETCIVWGTVKTTKTPWINSGYRNEKLPAVRVRKSTTPIVLDLAGVQHMDDLVDWYFLVEGNFKKTSPGNPYVSLQNAQRIAFLPESAGNLDRCV